MHKTLHVIEYSWCMVIISAILCFYLLVYACNFQKTPSITIYQDFGWFLNLRSHIIHQNIGFKICMKKKMSGSAQRASRKTIKKFRNCRKTKKLRTQIFTERKNMSNLVTNVIASKNVYNIRIASEFARVGNISVFVSLLLQTKFWILREFSFQLRKADCFYRTNWSYPEGLPQEEKLVKTLFRTIIYCTAYRRSITFHIEVLETETNEIFCKYYTQLSKFHSNI